ncbi:MAG: cytochrome P450 [Myxococcota bacterium]
MSDPATRAEEIVLELFGTPEGRSNPYPRYHRLREVAPVHYSPNVKSWFLSRYDDVAAIVRDPRFSKNYPRQMELKFGPSWRSHSSLARGEDSMINRDGPEHARLRRLVIKAFTRRAIDGLRPSIQRIMNDLLDPFSEKGGGDLMGEVAFPMPVTIIGELLGVPEADRAQFRSWVVDLVAIFEMQVDPEDLRKADIANDRIRAYFTDLIAEKRRKPDEALLSRLVNTEDDVDRLSDDELSAMALPIFAAGFETTTNLVGNGLYGLLKQPDQIQLLRKRPELFPLLPDELLRFDGTAQLVVRDTEDDVEVGGITIPTDQTVYGILGAANHDPTEFENPDQIDATRGRFRPMSFGGGAHFCLGASLARAEIEIAFRTLLERFDSIEFDGGPPPFRDRLTLRGLHTLPLLVKPAAAPRDLSVPAAKARAAEAEVIPTKPPSARRPVPTTPASVRPAPGSEADRAWRNQLRAQVESGAASPSFVRTGPDLATTIVLLARAGLFQSCSAREIAELAATAYPMSFEPGDLLCEEGAESLECYVVEEGEATVTIGGKPVRRIEANDVVGERGPLESQARSATVVATTHMNTFAISRQRLLDLAESSPSAREGMFAYMKERYAD